MVVGVREINDQDLPSTSWVNTTLQYTHGYGMIVSPSNVQTSTGTPQFAVGYVPPVSTEGLPQVTQPSVYFGLNNPGYVVANTKQPEIDYQLTNGTNIETHYKGDGGVQLSSFFKQVMFAVRFNDINLLISSQITNDSRLMFDRGVQARVAKAAPFLSLDADPYPVLVGGHIDWVQDAYTTTDNYPYAQNADTSAVAQGSGLNTNFNYVRNSVKVVIDAYTGKMTFYVMDPNDPIIETYEKAFPGMFTSSSKMPPPTCGRTCGNPEDIFTVQATMYGKYHIVKASEPLQRRRRVDALARPRFGLAPPGGRHHPDGQRPGPGRLDRPVGADVADRPGGPDSGGDDPVLQPARRGLVPVSTRQPDPDALRFHDCRVRPGPLRPAADVRDPGGESGQPACHPGREDRVRHPRYPATPLLNQNGSSVLLGNVLMIPVADALLYVQPLYVELSRNPVPGAAAGHRRLWQPASGDRDTLSSALTQLFAAPVSGQSDHGRVVDRPCRRRPRRSWLRPRRRTRSPKPT